MVTISPTILTMAAAPSAAGKPCHCMKNGKEKTPMKPPSLPTAAAIPWPIVRTFTGKIDKGGGIRPELGKEVTQAIGDEKRVRQLFNVRNEGEQAECHPHYCEAEALDGLAAQLVHRERRDYMTRRRENGEDCRAA
jgi:hypothetical protein